MFITTFSLCTCVVVLTKANVLSGSNIPTLYEYYTSAGIENGLHADKPNFHLNGKEIFIYSGAMHYFRVPRQYWRDRLRKFRAAGLNTVETYIPWNLHESESGKYDFGNGGNDMSDFLHLEEFLRIAKEEDLFTIIRSGPFICAEFDFGGFPSWLLRNHDIEFRTSNSVYMKYVTRWFNVLMPILASHQFTKGGPVIMFQVENEYANYGKHDSSYLRSLRDLMINNGIVELLVTSDSPRKGTVGTIPDLFLMTGNFNADPETQLDTLKKIQPNRPAMAMEYWSGWFDYWGDKHNNKTVNKFKDVYEGILKYPASVNMYMFHGGTNFRFLNGAQSKDSEYHSITTSYDYSSPLDESGDYTDKYWATKDLLEKYNPIKTKIPSVPSSPKKIAYSSVDMIEEMFLYDMLKQVDSVRSSKVIPMENLDINNGNGQSFGYIVYQKTGISISANATLMIEGRVGDNFMVLVNGILVSHWLENSEDLHQIGTSYIKNSKIHLSDNELTGATLEIVVENWGRMHTGFNTQYKGLWQGQVKLNSEYLYDWNIYPLEFKSTWTTNLSNWQTKRADSIGPALYKGTLTINDIPEDTFIYMESWIKGIVIVNGFVLGRYARMGPIQTVYLPAPFLVQGNNTIIVFEHFKPASAVDFRQMNIYNSH